MREIKFRAWGKNSKEFILADEQQGLTLKNIQALADLDSWELTQYTGLKDKNGKEIYEGDIVLADDEGEMFPQDLNDETMEWEPTGKYEVCFDHCSFQLKAAKGTDEPELEYSPWYDTEFEVIGNIYENPELLA